MHEFALAEDLLRVIRQEAEKQRAARVRAIRVKVGEMSGVEPDSLRLALEIVSKGTLVEGASTEMESIPATAQCQSCGKSFPVRLPVVSCPHCGGGRVKITSGQEIYVERIEVE